MGYRERAPPSRLRGLVECQWVFDDPPASVRVLPDGCMDLIRIAGRVVVAGLDTAASISGCDGERLVGLRFHPGALPRLLGVPAAEVCNERVPLDELRSAAQRHGSLIDVAESLAADVPKTETAPWSLPTLTHITSRLAAGAAVTDIARHTGWSSRTLQRQCATVYGYGPATLRRILRFRRAVRSLGTGLPYADIAFQAGYADQPHLHREIREFSGVPLRILAVDQSSNAANRSTDVPSASSTVA